MYTFQMKCRIDTIEQHNGAFFHIVTTPAQDAYSKPSSFKLRSPQQLGNAGNEVTLDVTVSGSVFKKNYRDSQTGIQKQFHEANVYLEAQHARAPAQAKSA